MPRRLQRCLHTAHVSPTASEVLADAFASFEYFGACAREPHDGVYEESPSDEDSDKEAPSKEAPSKEACCTGNSCCDAGSTGAKLNSEEKMLVQWFRESHALAKDAIELEAPTDEPFEWVDMSVDESVATVSVSQGRMQEIGLVLKNGQPPTREDPARFFWIQAKPTASKNQFGLWDPVGAQWKLFPGRAVVPIEQRIAPCRFGNYGADAFTDDDYGDGEAYTGTALEPALPHVRAQVRTLPEGTRVPSASGWGVSEHSAHAYYTPHLRHVAIDRSIPEAGGKKYVYKFAPRARVVPMEGQCTWNATNSCWVYRTQGPGNSRILPSLVGAPFVAEYSEQQRDSEISRVS